MQPSAAVETADLDHLYWKQMKPSRQTQNIMAPTRAGHCCLGQSLTRKKPGLESQHSGGLAPVNLSLTMAMAGSQVTVQGSVGAVTLISALMKNTGVPTTTKNGVQLLPTPPTQPVQQPTGAAVVPTPTAPQKGAVVAKLLAMNGAQTKEELEGQRE